MKKTIVNIFSLYLFIFIAWSVYRYYFSLPEWVDEILAKPILWLIPTFLMVILQEKKSVGSIGLSLSNFFKNLYLGWGLGALFALEGLLTNAIKYRGLLFVPIGLSIIDLCQMIAISLITAFSEEIVFRGFILSRLMTIQKSELFANIISAVLFSLIHLPIILFVLQYNPASLASYLFLTFILGLANGYLFIKTKTIVAPTISHAFWNLSIILFR